MKVIVCGAGIVGQGIARYLAGEKHDVTVVDREPELLSDFSEGQDVRTVAGHGPHPATLREAGAEDADIIIAVTPSDEVNMIVCQIAGRLFKVPHKIARVRDQNYMDEQGRQLFAEGHLEIDQPISPERELGEAILRLLGAPGLFAARDFVRGRLRLGGVSIEEDCPVASAPVRQISDLFSGLRLAIGGVVRAGLFQLADDETLLEPGDEAYFLVDSRDLDRARGIFGLEEPEARHVVIAGAGDAGRYVMGALMEKEKRIRVKMIEEDRDKANRAADSIQNIKEGMIYRGSPIDAALLRQAGIAEAEVYIALTGDDETNIMSTVLARREGCSRTICAYNNPAYAALMPTLNIDAYLSQREITISTILRHIRAGGIEELHAVHDGAAEVIEGKVLRTSAFAEKALKDVKLPKGAAVTAIWRNGDFLLPKKELEIKPEDRVLLFTLAGKAPDVEKLFTVDPEYF